MNMNYLGLFIGGIVLFSAQIIVWSIFYCEKINYKNFWIYLSVFFLTLLSIFNHILVNPFLKILIITFLITIFNWLIFRKKLNETIISSIYGQLLATISEALGILLLVLIFRKDVNFVENNFFDTLVGNVVVALIYVGMSFVPLIK